MLYVKPNDSQFTSGFEWGTCCMLSRMTLSSPLVLSGVRVARSFSSLCSGLYIVVCLFFRLSIVLSVLRITLSDYAFVIFKLIYVVFYVFVLNREIWILYNQGTDITLKYSVCYFIQWMT